MILGNLTGKIALVTGSSRGIGAAIARRLALEGAAVVVNYSGSEAAADAVVAQIEDAGGRAIALRADVTDRISADALFEETIARFGGLDIVVNNAGITRDGLIVRMSDDDWTDVIATNLTGVFNVTRAVTRHLMKQRSGAIINGAVRDRVAIGALDLGVKAGIIDKSGAWFTYGQVKLGQGRENAKQFLRDHPDMAASIENRPPFLDHELVELAFRVDSAMKIKGSSGKWLIKEIARKHLPENIVDRKKVGFKVPLDTWFRGSLKDYVHDLLLGPDSFVSSYFNRRIVTNLLADHTKGRRNEELRLWTLMGLEIWHRAFFRTIRQ